MLLLLLFSFFFLIVSHIWFAPLSLSLSYSFVFLGRFENTEIPSLIIFSDVFRPSCSCNTDGRMDGRKKAEYYTKICGVEPNATEGGEEQKIK